MKHFNLFVLGLTIPKLTDSIAVIGVIIASIPLISGINAFIISSRLRDENLTASIRELTLKLELYITSEKDREIQRKENFSQFSQRLEEIERDILTLKVLSGKFPDRRQSER